MRQTTSKLLQLIMIALMFLLSFPFHAFATVVDYDVVNYENTTAGNNSMGTDAALYVMNNPTIYNQHVSSVYVDNWLPGVQRYFVESGWFANWPQSQNKPRWFAGWVNQGNYGEKVDNPYPEAGPYKVAVAWWGGVWHWYAGGAWIKEMPNTWHSGKSTVSSERDETRDTNYSHFWQITDKNQSHVWTDWTNRTNLKDNDTAYDTYENPPGNDHDIFISTSDP